MQGSSVIEGSTDQRIYLSYSLDEEGREWATPESVPEKLREAGQWSPVLHCDQSGALWLFYAESATNCLRKPINRPGKPPVPQRWAVRPVWQRSLVRCHSAASSFVWKEAVQQPAMRCCWIRGWLKAHVL